MENKIDLEQYKTLQEIYDYFNKHLFSDSLPEIIFTIDYRKSDSNGFFHPEKFKENEKSISVINLNPDHFDRENIDCMATIAHEMCHAWKHYQEGATKAYHCKGWGAKMESIGLMPSDTGQEGGKKTGRRMHHYIISGGKFVLCANDFISAHEKVFLFSGIAQIKIPADKAKNKIKYTCGCGQNVWGKPDMEIICGECKQYFLSYDEKK